MCQKKTLRSYYDAETNTCLEAGEFGSDDVNFDVDDVFASIGTAAPEPNRMLLLLVNANLTQQPIPPPTFSAESYRSILNR